MEDSIYISVEKQCFEYFDVNVPKNFKKIKEMTFEELKTAYHTRIVEKNEAHPESVFQKFYDEEMILLTNEIKLRKDKN